MQINWGHKIALLYIGFVVLILTLVVKTMGHKVDLIYNDYYDKELQYQETLDSKANLSNAEGKLDIDQTEGNLIVNLPSSIKDAKGELILLRPSDSRLDRRFPVSQEGIRIPTQSLIKGLYLLQLRLEAGGKSYFHEQQITIQ